MKKLNKKAVFYNTAFSDLMLNYGSVVILFSACGSESAHAVHFR